MTWDLLIVVVEESISHLFKFEFSIKNSTSVNS